MAISNNIILGFKNGNQDDIAKVYLEYRNLLFFVISNYIDNIEDCNDVLSNVYIKIVENKDNYKDITSVKSYLTSIAKNEAINYLKKQREVDIETSDESFIYLDKKGEALSYLEPLLDKKSALIVIYHAVFDYTWKEISLELGLSESSIRNIYRDAKKILRKEYSHL